MPLDNRKLNNGKNLKVDCRKPHHPEETLIQWHQLRVSGMSSAGIAEKFGVTKNTVVGALYRYENPV